MDNNSQPLVSVIMNCYNGEKYLHEAIDSVYAQTYDNWEIIFWDNCSTDSSAKIAKSYDSKLKYYCGDDKIPLGAARNLAIEKTNGDLIAFLDVDDVWYPKKLSKQVSEFMNKDIVLNFTNAQYIYDDGSKYNLYRSTKVFEADLFPRLLESNIICLASVMIQKRAMFRLDQLFDDTLMVSEEYDLFLRLAYGNKCSYISGSPLTKYRVHNNNLSHSSRLLFPRENELIIKKLLERDPKVMTQYEKAIKKSEANIAFLYALEEYRANNKLASRKILFPHLKSNRKYIVLYLFTFIDFKYFAIFIKLIKKKHLI